MITIFKDTYSTTNPSYTEVDLALESIQSCSLQKRIDEIRAEKDHKKQQELKKQLPIICWSGKFTERKDAACIQHSGFCVLDLDNLEDVQAKKEGIKKLPYVYACFVSPSGNGLKVLVKIPPSIEDHRGHYRALMKLFPQVDKTSINLSRACYASADADVYINREAVEFTDYEEDIKFSGFGALSTPIRMIREAKEGEKHNTLLRAAQLVGGMISGGNIKEEEAVKILELEIQKRNPDNFRQAQRTIREGIEFGKNRPIEDEFIASKLEADEYITQIRNGTFQMGLSTGIKELDEHWRLKPKSFIINNGLDGVGKSLFMWYVSMLSAILHDWKWIIHAAENKVGGVKQRLIEFNRCKSIKSMSEEELKFAMDFVENHYTFLKSNDLWTYRDLLNIGGDINARKQHNVMLIDPYNSLYFPDNKDRHEWDYRATSEMRSFIKETGCSVYLNCHPVTEALRRRHPNGHDYAGHPMPPDKADTEGGGKFANRADDFMTTHRYVYHLEQWMFTHIYIRKIKEEETGGHPTSMDSPVKIRRIEGGYGFQSVPDDGTQPVNPILNYYNKSKLITPNPNV